jgi:hypothetical protein
MAPQSFGSFEPALSLRDIIVKAKIKVAAAVRKATTTTAVEINTSRRITNASE